MIGIVVRDLPYLKLLHPICEQFIEMKVPYIIYHMDCYRGEKQYNNASLSNIQRSSEGAVSGAKKVKKFSTDTQLLKQLAHDRVKKLVSVEIWLWAKGYINKLKTMGIKTYSLNYLTDSLWQPAASITTIDRIYYGSEHIMRKHLEFTKTKYNPLRDIYHFGSPIFDPIAPQKEAKDVLILLPNLRKEHVKKAFGSADGFVKIIAKLHTDLSSHGSLILKTRKKQWYDKRIDRYAKEIYDDGDIMYPQKSVDLFRRCHTTVMFFSSGIFEAVYAGNYVVNIAMPLGRWDWDKERLYNYFHSNHRLLGDGDYRNMYDFYGATRHFEQADVLNGAVGKHISENAGMIGWQDELSRERENWIRHFIGKHYSDGNITNDSAARIAKDVVNG